MAPRVRQVMLPAALLLGAAGANLAGAAPAAASTVRLDGATLRYEAAPGEANRLSVSSSGDTLTVSDVGASVSAGAGCTTVSATVATCPAAGVAAMALSLGDMNDTASVARTSIPTSFDDGPGNDVETGGDAVDTFVAGAGSDTFHGGPGQDIVDYSGRTAALSVSLDNVANDGEAGEKDNVGTDVEAIVGGSGADTLTASGWANDIYGGPGDDTLQGGAGNDTLDGGAGADAIGGGSGTDVADYSARSAPVKLSLDGQANDGEAGEGDNIASDVETLRGGAGDDTLTGGPGNNTLDGGPGNDTLDGGPGADALIGGDGQDLADYSSRTTPVSVTLTGGGDDGVSGEHDNVSSDVENVIGGSAADKLTGDSADNVLSGGPGDDTLDGGSGNDTLYGGAGDDRLLQSYGDDTLDGGDGNDLADYSAERAPLTITLDGQPNDGENGERDNVEPDVERVSGGYASDRLIGSDGPNVLVGNGGSDTLVGGGGNDSLQGGFGDDILDGSSGADDIQGGAGSDTVDYSLRTAGVTVTLDEQPNDGEPGEGDDVHGDVETLVGGSGSDHLSGNAALNTIYGGRGNDTINGYAGNDVLAGEAGRDHINGGKGSDRIDGGPDGDHIETRDGYPDFVRCGKGRDSASLDKHDRQSSCERRRHSRGRGGHAPAATPHAPRVTGRRGALVRLARVPNPRRRYPSVHSHVRKVSPCTSAAALRPTWAAAARAFGLKWTVLAAITQIESGFGCNMGPSSAGAIGWTQFMPASWRRWGMDADGDHRASPYNSVDAIFSTARYLRASGAPRSYRRAIFAYNHAGWYVRDVLHRAKLFGA